MRNGQSGLRHQLITLHRQEELSISNFCKWVKNSWQRVKSRTVVKSLKKNVALAMHWVEVKMIFYMKEVTP
jgi:hypothetical protein